MHFSKFEKLWDGIKPLHCLKLIDLSYSEYLKEIPDLSKATSLEKLNLQYCKSLLKLTSSIGNATKLKKCDLLGCLLLKELPSSISRLINLEVLSLGRCQSLKALSVFSSLEKLSGCSSLKELRLTHTAIEEVPLSMSTWSCLYKLNMSDCKNLKEFPNVPDSIVELVLCSTGIEEVPPQIEKLFRLRKLIMYGCEKLKTISPNISKLENLEFLGLRKDGQGEYDRERVDEFGLKLFEAVIKWGPDLNHSWELRSDFRVHHILPICLPKKAFTSPVSLCLRCVGLKTIPDCIGFLSGLSELDITECRKLRALPQLPASLISLDAQNCESLESIDSSSFQNPNICLDFANCFNLNQEARRLIQTSACTYALLPGRKVPAHFTHQATSGCLTINLSPKSLPSSFRFRACILVPTDSWHYSVPANGLSCNVSGKQNDLTVEYGTNHIHHMPGLEECREHLYIFEDSFSLNQDFPEGEETTSSELSFVFRLYYGDVKIKGCGVQLLQGAGKERNDEVKPCVGIPLQCLKLMDLGNSYNLKEIPDLSNATSLEELVLCGCKSLLEITSSIGNATKLKKCYLFGCWLLKELPSSISRLINLEVLSLGRCQSLKALSVFSSLEKLSGCSSLKELRLTHTAIEEVPLSMSTWSCLYKLNMSDCKNLKEFPNVPDSIVELVLCKTRIEEVPSWIGNLSRLRKLIMYGCKKLKTISPNISKLDNLEFLGLRKDGEDEYDRERVGESGLKLFEAVIKWGPDLNHSWELRSDFRVHHILPICLPKKAFTSPVSLCLRCVGLKTIPDCIGFLSGLSELDITECRKLFPYISRCRRLCIFEENRLFFSKSKYFPKLLWLLQTESKSQKDHPNISLQICALTW
ncbi:unnamed protein product [Brassica oleracea]